MVKVKNVRPGILVIADAGLKLTPGESRDVEELTPQTRDAISNGFLTQVDKAADKAQAKSSSRRSEEKGSEKSKTAKLESGEQAASKSTDDTGGSGEQRDPAQQSLVEVGSGDQ